jgi:trans-aconitate 2-methyltransferase
LTSRYLARQAVGRSLDVKIILELVTLWDPQRYLTYADQRARPFHDLLARVGAVDPATVVDLGCGPGNLTSTLAERWPSARVIGVDSSAEMVAVAREVPSIEVVGADVRDWRPGGPVDVVISNATLQWVPDHLNLLPRFVGWLAPQGWLAFQVPGNFAEPSHALLRQVADSPRWRDRVGGDRVARPSSPEPADYLAALADLDCVVDVWETTYLHVLPGADAVLDWISGTGLRPVLAALDGAEQAEFRAEYGALLRAAYPARPYGTVLPYRRIFAVGRRRS